MADFDPWADVAVAPPEPAPLPVRVPVRVPVAPAPAPAPAPAVDPWADVAKTVDQVVGTYHRDQLSSARQGDGQDLQWLAQNAAREKDQADAYDLALGLYKRPVQTAADKANGAAAPILRAPTDQGTLAGWGQGIANAGLGFVRGGTSLLAALNSDTDSQEQERPDMVSDAQGYREIAKNASDYADRVRMDFQNSNEAHQEGQKGAETVAGFLPFAIPGVGLPIVAASAAGNRRQDLINSGSSDTKANLAGAAEGALMYAMPWLGGKAVAPLSRFVGDAFGTSGDALMASLRNRALARKISDRAAGAASGGVENAAVGGSFPAADSAVSYLTGDEERAKQELAGVLPSAQNFGMLGAVLGGLFKPHGGRLTTDLRDGQQGPHPEQYAPPTAQKGIANFQGDPWRDVAMVGSDQATYERAYGADAKAEAARQEALWAPHADAPGDKTIRPPPSAAPISVEDVAQLRQPAPEFRRPTTEEVLADSTPEADQRAADASDRLDAFDPEQIGALARMDGGERTQIDMRPIEENRRKIEERIARASAPTEELPAPGSEHASDRPTAPTAESSKSSTYSSELDTQDLAAGQEKLAASGVTPEPLPRGTPVHEAPVPLAGGTSKDGGRIYMSPHLAEPITVRRLDGTEAKVDARQFVAIHESVEKPLMDHGLTYEQAHAIATKAEEDAVRSRGFDPVDYQAKVKPLVERARADAGRQPADLETKPYAGSDAGLLKTDAPAAGKPDVSHLSPDAQAYLRGEITHDDINNRPFPRVTPEVMAHPEMARALEDRKTTGIAAPDAAGDLRNIAQSVGIVQGKIDRADRLAAKQNPNAEPAPASVRPADRAAPAAPEAAPVEAKPAASIPKINKAASKALEHVSDILDEIRSLGGIEPKPKGHQGGEYDRPQTLPLAHAKMISGTAKPDMMASYLHDRGIGDGTVDGMWQAVDAASHERLNPSVDASEAERGEPGPTPDLYPHLANPLTDLRDRNAYVEVRNLRPKIDVQHRADVIEAAKENIAKDSEAEHNRLRMLHDSNTPLSAFDNASEKEMLEQLRSQGRVQEFEILSRLYDHGGTDQARAFGMRADMLKTPKGQLLQARILETLRAPEASRKLSELDREAKPIKAELAEIERLKRALAAKDAKIAEMKRGAASDKAKAAQPTAGRVARQKFKDTLAKWGKRFVQGGGPASANAFLEGAYEVVRDGVKAGILSFPDLMRTAASAIRNIRHEPEAHKAFEQVWDEAQAKDATMEARTASAADAIASDPKLSAEARLAVREKLLAGLEAYRAKYLADLRGMTPEQRMTFLEGEAAGKHFPPELQAIIDNHNAEIRALDKQITELTRAATPEAKAEKIKEARTDAEKEQARLDTMDKRLADREQRLAGLSPDKRALELALERMEKRTPDDIKRMRADAAKSLAEKRQRIKDLEDSAEGASSEVTYKAEKIKEVRTREQAESARLKAFEDRTTGRAEKFRRMSPDERAAELKREAAAKETPADIAKMRAESAKKLETVRKELKDLEASATGADVAALKRAEQSESDKLATLEKNDRERAAKLASMSVPERGEFLRKEAANNATPANIEAMRERASKAREAIRKQINDLEAETQVNGGQGQLKDLQQQLVDLQSAKNSTIKRWQDEADRLAAMTLEERKREILNRKPPAAIEAEKVAIRKELAPLRRVLHVLNHPPEVIGPELSRKQKALEKRYSDNRKAYDDITKADDKRRAADKAQMKKLGYDTDNPNEWLHSPGGFQNYLAARAATEGGMSDVAREHYVGVLHMSGGVVPKKILADVVTAAPLYLTQRMLEATTNSITAGLIHAARAAGLASGEGPARQADSAHWKEVGQIFARLIPAIGKGIINGAKTLWTEKVPEQLKSADNPEHYPVTRGRVGWATRQVYLLTAVKAMDAGARTVITHMEVVAQAYRSAIDADGKRLTGDALANHILHEVETYTSDSWNKARQEANDRTFNGKPDWLTSQINKLKHMDTAGRPDKKAVKFIANVQYPIVGIPARIALYGIKHWTPGISDALAVMNSMRRDPKTGNWQYSRNSLNSDAARAIMRLSAIWGLASLYQNGEITGEHDPNHPNSIKLFGTWVSVQHVPGLNWILPTVADWLHGGMSDVKEGAMKRIGETPWFRPIADLLYAAKSSDGFPKYAASRVPIPSILRQGYAAGQDFQQDRRAVATGESGLAAKYLGWDKGNALDRFNDYVMQNVMSSYPVKDEKGIPIERDSFDGSPGLTKAFRILSPMQLGLKETSERDWHAAYHESELGIWEKMRRAFATGGRQEDKRAAQEYHDANRVAIQGQKRVNDRITELVKQLKEPGANVKAIQAEIRTESEHALQLMRRGKK